MTDAPNHETFNILDALEGVTYPTDTVPVSFDAKLMHLIADTDKEIADLVLLKRHDEAEQLQRELDNLKEQAKETFFTFEIRAVDRGLLRAQEAKALKKYPEEKDIFNRVERDRQREEYSEILYLSLHVISVTSPSGAKQLLFDEETARQFVAKAPAASVNALMTRIQELYQGSNKGYEDSIKDLDFLSGASRGE